MAEFLREAALDIAATRYLTIAAVTALLYDHRWCEVNPFKGPFRAYLLIINCSVLTLGDEVALIWPAKVRVL